ncbi:MAG: Ig-like domain-containing protein [Candidatus Neomarinimicrobiota bacterium]
MKKIIIILLSVITILSAQDLSGYKFYINAGHGGHGSNDRPPINDAGYWESEGNITRTLVMETILKRWGATILMSRTQNRSSDDLGLSGMGEYASTQNCDWFHSAHSNASGGNYTLMLYSGFTGDPRINKGAIYSPSSTKFAGMLTMSNYMGNNIYAALQTSNYIHAGDYTFYGKNRNYLGVFRKLTIPGTLSESCFHDYWPQTYRLQNLDNRINDAWAMSLAFLQYYNQPLPNMANLAGIIRTKEQLTDYEYIGGTNDQYKPIDSIEVTIHPLGDTTGSRIYYGNRTMYIDKYTPQWSQITTGSPINPNNWAAIDNSSNYDYYMNGYNNNHGYNRNNGFYLFDSLTYGTYQLIYDAPGYWPDTAQITIDNSKFFWTKNYYLTSSAPPYVKNYSPKNNETEHPAWEPVVIEFSHAMDTAAVRSGFSIAPETDLNFNWSSNYKKLSLSAFGDSLEVETDYTIRLKSDLIKGNRDQNLDGNGDGIAGDDFVLSFTTSPKDIFPPKIMTWYPSKNQRYSDLQPIISYVYDELIDVTPDLVDKFRFYRTTGDDIEIPFEFETYSVQGKTIVSLFPTQQLERSNAYMRVISKGISDKFDNTTTNNQTSAMIITSTIPYYADTLIIDSFTSSSIESNWRDWGFSGSNLNLIDGERSASTKFVNHCNGSTSSLKLYFKFDPEAQTGFYRQWVDGNSTPGSKKFDKGDVMQAWVFGDGSNVNFRFCVDDPTNSGISEVSPWYPIDFFGWQLIRWDMRKGETGIWPGISDGTLDGPLNFDSFQIEYIDSIGSNEGTIYIEDLMVMTPGGVSIDDVELPSEFSLNQNYPNPFNPTTTLEYSLDQRTNVNLSVYDVHGRLIATLINEDQFAGSYTTNFSAGPLPSGVYIARLKTDMGILSKKMLLVK